MSENLVKTVEEDESIPAWINKSYMEKVLQSYKNDNTIKITKLRLENATKMGEGYACVMVRIIVEYSSISTAKPYRGTYLVKFPYGEDTYCTRCIREIGLYDQEINVYQNYLPVMKSLLKEASIDASFYPETIHVDYENSALIFEDLKVKSYKLIDCIVGVDEVHAKMVLQKLARMHAASAKMDEITPGVFKSCDRGMHNRHTKVSDIYFEDSFDNCIRVASEWENFSSYVEKMRKLRPYVMEYTRRCFDMEPDFFNVLTHGDLWTNNVMFKYNENNEVVDVLMFDYQLSCYTSPVVDLMFFLNTSLEDELRFHHQNVFVEYYFQQLVENLKILKYSGKIPTLEEFWDQYNKKNFFCAITGMVDRSVIGNDDTAEADYITVMGDEEYSYSYRKKLYENPRMQNNLKILIPLLDQRGLLDLK